MTDTYNDLPIDIHDLTTIKPPIAVGPLDGRYRSTTQPLVNYFSEAALNRARIHVEIEWLIYLLEHRLLPGAPSLSDEERAYLRRIVTNFDATAIDTIKQIEAQTKHDVKAVEYYIKECISKGPQTLHDLGEIVHIFCTSEDINNLSYALVIRAGMQRVWLPKAQQLIDDISVRARNYSDVSMLAHTHGQPATPVTLGKELAVTAYRLHRQIRRIERTNYLGKFNGATGTWAAHAISLPSVDWPLHTRKFIEQLGLEFNPLTTQIESHDWQSELFGDIARFNRIAHNFATDMWTYISMGYFVQNLGAQGSTGSSTMPHKVNPIRFENAEANLEVSCALLDSLSATLVTSRLQRDLTDSTTQRNIGVALGHSLLALDNLVRGLAGVDANKERMEDDLDANWEVLGEAIQQAMRVESIAGVKGMDNPYERLKELTRGRKINASLLREFITSLEFSTSVKKRLLNLTPSSYCGYSAYLSDVTQFFSEENQIL
ncbi:MAG: adenylosuccinate lyase [Actinomycetaceae bacterium]|nr:adenylosuccinate lyase [Actinomycetaceae bacterium]